jgi:gentisate 1,2-dioxygenase
MSNSNNPRLDTLDALYRAFDGLSMEGGWHRRSPALWSEPRKNLLPYRWRYAEVKPILEAAGSLVSTELAERRNLTMTNPVEGNIYPTVRSLVAAYQMIKPGETADSHRHTPNALRLILDGCGTYTVVNGTRVEMRPGDVLLTPSWQWHSHENVGSEDCYWVDILDVPLIHLLEPMFFERHPDKLEREVVDVAEAPIAFRWEDTLARLDAASPPAHGMAEREVELGSPAMPTIALHMQRLSPGFISTTSRSTANHIFTVVQGSGKTVVDGETLTWSRGDVIAIPSWRPYQHEAFERSFLLSASDKPVMNALGLLREQLSGTTR